MKYILYNYTFIKCTYIDIYISIYESSLLMRIKYDLDQHDDDQHGDNDHDLFLSNL